MPQLSRADRRAQDQLHHLQREARKQVVRILNPKPGGAQRVNGARADELVYQRRIAEYVGKSAIRMIDCHQVKEAAGIDADRAIHSLRAGARQLAGVPVIKPQELLAPSPRAGWAWEKAVWRRR